jgi:hypothetical protein
MHHARDVQGMIDKQVPDLICFSLFVTRNGAILLFSISPYIVCINLCFIRSYFTLMKHCGSCKLFDKIVVWFHIIALPCCVM